MSFSDKLTTFALNTPLNGADTNPHPLGNVVDIQDARDIGNGKPVYFIVTAATDFTGSSAYTVSLVSDSSDPLSGGETILTCSVANASTVKAGDILYQSSLPLEGKEYSRYLGLIEQAATAAVSGYINAYLSMDPVKWEAYPEGRN